MRRVNLNSGSEIDSTTYERLVKFAVGSLAGYWRNRHALGTLGRHWVRHFYANIAALSRSDTPLVSPSTNKRARVIIGAGPSLDKAFDFIISHRDKLDVWRPTPHWRRSDDGESNPTSFAYSRLRPGIISISMILGTAV